MSIQKFYQKVETIVDDLLKKENIDSAPIPVEKIADNYGVSPIAFEFGEDISGVLVFKDSIGTIGFNKSHPKVRQRFTIAHEFGHYILHRDSNKNLFVDKDFLMKFRSNVNYTEEELKQERQANIFAAALLMPAQLIKAEARKEKYKNLTELEVIEELAKLFNVSREAMSYRLNDISTYFYND